MSTDDLTQTVTELSLLKDRARAMGIPVPNNVSVETLKQRINARQEGDTAAATAPSVAEVILNNFGTPEVAPVRQLSLREYLHQREMKLIRLRITCLDPKKKDLPGEIITFANEYLGTVRKFVPFGEQTDNGYHVPYCIYRILKRRQFLQIKVSRDAQKREVVTSRYVREFALEELEPLTKEELAKLAIVQMADENRSGVTDE
jgi:hypothetical protein